MDFYNFLSRIIFRRHELLIDINDLTAMMKILDDHDLTLKGKVFFGNCGWAKAPDVWFVIFNCSDRLWYEILPEIKESKIEILPEYIGY